VPRISTQPLRGFRRSGLSLPTTTAGQNRSTGRRKRRTTGSHVPHQSPDQARATSMPETTWAVLGYPPGSSRTIQASPVSISSFPFDTSTVVRSRSPSWPIPAALNGATFPATLTTTALDRSSLRWFAASPRRATTEDHQPNRPAPPSPIQHRSDRPEPLLQRLVTFRVHTLDLRFLVHAEHDR
jgi:hypothetical protein